MLTQLEDLAAQIGDGASIIMPKGEAPDTPLALIHEVIRQERKGLHIVTLPACANPVSGMAVDMLIGSGCVSSIETSGVSLGEIGAAPQFGAAVREGRIAITDATCPALYAAVQAGGKGQPFTTLRGLIGSDIERHRADYRVIDNPFQPGDPVVVIKAINSDIAIFHAQAADRNGNIWIGRNRDLLYASHAAERTLVTVEELRDEDFFADDAIAAGVLPSAYVSALAHVPGGARTGIAGAVADHVARYRQAARTGEGFAAWMADTVLEIAA